MVVVNGVELSHEDQQKLAQATGASLPPGRWWYDRVSGAWGVEGGPTQGFTQPNIGLFAPLREDASRGKGALAGLARSRVYLNGREIHLLEAQWLAQLLGLGAVWGGARYSLDPAGNFGPEGQPPAVNLFQLVAQAQAMAQMSGMPAQGGGGGAYCRQGPFGYTGGDGQTSYFFDPNTGASVMV